MIHDREVTWACQRESIDDDKQQCTDENSNDDFIIFLNAVYPMNKKRANAERVDSCGRCRMNSVFRSYKQVEESTNERCICKECNEKLHTRHKKSGKSELSRKQLFYHASKRHLVGHAQ